MLVVIQNLFWDVLGFIQCQARRCVARLHKEKCIALFQHVIEVFCQGKAIVRTRVQAVIFCKFARKINWSLFYKMLNRLQPQWHLTGPFGKAVSDGPAPKPRGALAQRRYSTRVWCTVCAGGYCEGWVQTKERKEGGEWASAKRVWRNFCKGVLFCKQEGRRRVWMNSVEMYNNGNCIWPAAPTVSVAAHLGDWMGMYVGMYVCVNIRVTVLVLGEDTSLLIFPFFYFNCLRSSIVKGRAESLACSPYRKWMCCFLAWHGSDLCRHAVDGRCPDIPPFVYDVQYNYCIP